MPVEAAGRGVDQQVESVVGRIRRANRTAISADGLERARDRLRLGDERGRALRQLAVPVPKQPEHASGEEVAQPERRDLRVGGVHGEAWEEPGTRALGDETPNGPVVVRSK